ncbi:unnamed protein product [Paramecium sonneborni]|uniref:Transmembrane protein n=1 Tax=Paramecium sonneborni TaxID=65129 RepID=A0A8S1KRE2_9CILI|nr:unnamed protein product [Paramecium sonneborni]
MLGFRQLSSKYTHSVKKLIVNSFNLFGVQPKLTITKAKSVNTFLGSTFTILLLIMIIALLLYDLNEFTQREQPRVIISENEIDTNREYSLDQSNFTLALAIYNKDFIPIEQMERYFTLSIQFCKKTKNTDQNLTYLNCTNIETVPCQENNFQNKDYQKYFVGTNLSNFMCIKNNQFDIHKPSFQGLKQSDIYNYFTIKLSICRNTTDQQDCFSEENIKIQLFQTYYTYYLIDNLLQLDNSQNLTQSILRKHHLQIYNNHLRQIKQQYMIYENVVDKAFIYTQNEYHHYLQLQEQKELLIFDPSNLLVDQEIDLNYKQTKLIISYMKVSTFLSKFGGYIIIIYIFFNILLQPINKLFYLIHLSNKIFRFKILQNDFNLCQQGNDQIVQNSAYYQNIESPNSYCLVNVNENLILQNSRIFTYLQNLKNSLKLTWGQIITILLGCSKDQKNQLKQAEIKLNQKIDVTFLIKKLMELEKLKYILLNDDQLNLFNSAQKPILFFDEKNYNNQKQYFDEDSKLTKIQKGFKSYVSLQQKSQKGATDLKLLSLLDNDIINLYEQLYRDITFKSFFQNITLKESKTLKSKKNSKGGSPDQQMHKHVKLQTNADQ